MQRRLRLPRYRSPRRPPRSEASGGPASMAIGKWLLRQLVLRDGWWLRAPAVSCAGAQQLWRPGLRDERRLRRPLHARHVIAPAAGAARRAAAAPGPCSAARRPLPAPAPLTPSPRRRSPRRASSPPAPVQLTREVPAGCRLALGRGGGQALPSHILGHVGLPPHPSAGLAGHSCLPGLREELRSIRSTPVDAWERWSLAILGQGFGEGEEGR
ncbi:hypothetical protein C2845_PM17G03670 [Panicum miliaceum]|uniref:Uncharacterized protein n=1 Tax=Panicum miliaceum TaxID=4540 RepID=A0A3L6Q1K5_PANMI|nr:hypothetical protein C2845_PM17G03670 [Panicum miliaceum]